MHAILTRYMDYVFGNETEARTFSRVHGWEVNIHGLFHHVLFFYIVLTKTALLLIFVVVFYTDR